jgi:hypothetical protein
VIDNSNESIVAAIVSENDLILSFITDQTGTAEIVIEGISNGKSVTDTMLVTIEPVSGLDGISGKDLVIYPNPSGGKFRIESASAGKLGIGIYDLNGKRVYLNEHYTAAEEIDISDQPAGQYIIRLKIGSTVLTRSVILE